MKRILIFVVLCIWLLGGCAGIKPVQNEFLLKIQPLAPAVLSTKDPIHRSMEIPNQEGSLSNISFVVKDEAFIKIFSSLTIGDVTRLWNDICILNKMSDIKTIHLFLNSGGGDAFSGLALSDQIERAKKMGFTVIGHATGLVASAAIPVLAVCNIREVTAGTIFMVHETAIWKWPGRETHSDIKSQNALMDLLRDRYLAKLEKYTKLSKIQWGELENKTTWFNAEQALKWGLVDKIE